MFKNIFSFDGRIRRTEYWLTGILIQVVIIPIVFIVGIGTAGIGLLLLAIPIWISIAAAVKRSHDMGNSGWLCLIPIYNPLFLAFGGSQPFTNQYGENPKGVNIPTNSNTIQHTVVNNYLAGKETEEPATAPTPNATSVAASSATFNAPVAETATQNNRRQYSDSNKINKLRQLKELFDADILTQEEFNEQKAKILAS